MTSTLSSRMGLLTKATSKLSSLFQEFAEDLAQPIVVPLSEEERRKYIQEKKLRLNRIRKSFEMGERSVDNALKAYTNAADDLSSETPQLKTILERITANSEAAQELIVRAQTTVCELELQLQELTSSAEPTMVQEEAPRIELAPVPIPKFSGKVWEWESFWSAFEHSVHSRKMDDIYKMNYLLDAMRGEARESIKQFEVSGRTYEMAIEHLKKRYGNAQLLIRELIERLEKTKAKSRKIEDQRKLSEELCSIVNQMELRGEMVDSAVLQKQILSKFTEAIQRHTLRKKQELPDGEFWSTKMLLSVIQAYINTELEIHRSIDIRDGIPRDSFKRRSTSEEERQQIVRKKSFVCFYCESSGHVPRDCPVHKTREQRLEILKNRSLCRNCGGQNHMASECTKGACRLCGTVGHHTSICRDLTPQDKGKGPVHASSTKGKTETTTSRPAKQHLVTSSSPLEKEEETLETAMCMNCSGQTKDLVILVGAAQVLNPRTQTRESVHVLLDTGADRSFITDKLATRLQLDDARRVKLKISTFGSHEPMEKTCGITNVHLRDSSGEDHSFSVTRINAFTDSLYQSKFSGEDMQFIAENRIELSIEPYQQVVHPQILLGCSDVFSLLYGDSHSTWILPSGIKLVPSRLGYLVAGKLQEEVATDQTYTDAFAADTHMEVQNWERFLAFEGAGLHDFSGTKAKEQEKVDQLVWNTFESTISRCERGYQVRLPWTTEASVLPDNKALAYRRLCSILNRLKCSPDILQQYHQNFVDQVSKGILEKVQADNKNSSGAVVHYLAHQAVVTPDKEFTKLRVVYDASAHLKDKPSLNDALERGLVMLSAMLHMLLRFRIGNIAIISDVEKAFLQVHLHPDDRDAVRCLWVRDITRPPTGSNVIEYRFTRVPFGLKCSPFLLAGTIRHHLSTTTDNPAVAKEILANVYVDNVILTATTQEEAVAKYQESKSLFKAMNMNLRGFQTNRDAVNAQIPQEDRSSNRNPKVLGIVWDARGDCLSIEEKITKKTEPTKRIVSEQVASIFDPMGWLTPLLLKAKLLLQALWQSGYDWDTKLSTEHEMEWIQICSNISGYRRWLPRRVASSDSVTQLVLFADASNSAMAACAYLVTKLESHLLFAKSRLPNPKERPTIPKMEINAATLAARIAHMVYRALESKVRISSITILSDSQISLSWLSTYPLRKDCGVLVKNRVNEIRRIVRTMDVSVRFGYVDTKDNPADCATRGLTSTSMDQHMWWTGPEFLKLPDNQWPESCKIFRLPQDETGDTAEEEIQNCSSMTAKTTAKGTMEYPLEWKRHNTLNSAITAGCFLMAIAVGYIFLWTCGVKILSMIAHLFIRITRFQLED